MSDAATPPLERNSKAESAHDLSANGVTVRLGGKTVLHDVSLRLAAGQLVAVVGANGAGKSTLLRTMAGLTASDAGTVTIDGVAISNLHRMQLGRTIAYVPQSRTVHWPLPVERVAALGRLPHRRFGAVQSANDRRIVEAALKSMDVLHLRERPIATLSGGERARVLIARALAQQSQFIIADEPTAGLDAAHALSLFEEFSRLSRCGRGVLVALHDLSLAARYADAVLVLKRGRCLSFGQPDQALSSDNLRRAFAVESIVTTLEGIPVVVTKRALPDDPELG